MNEDSKFFLSIGAGFLLFLVVMGAGNMLNRHMKHRHLLECKQAGISTTECIRRD